MPADHANPTPDKLERKNIRYEIFFKIFQMVGLSLGGIGVFATFVYQNYPNLHGSSTITPQVTVDYVNNKMHVSCYVTIKNNGKIDFEIEGPVKIKVWLIPIKELTKNSYFNWESYMAKVPATTEAKDPVFREFNYAHGDSIKISHDFFIDTSDRDTARYTVLARADVKFKFSGVFGHDKRDSDYAYDVKIRYKEADPGNPLLTGKSFKAVKSGSNRRGGD